MKSFNLTSFVLIVLVTIVNSHTTQRPHSNNNDDGNPFLDMASAFLQETLANQNGGNGIASLIGNLIQPDGAGGKSDNGAGAGAILSGIGSLIANVNGGNGFDPSMIGNVIDMFTGGVESGKQKKSSGGSGIEAMLSLATTFLANNNQNQNQERSNQQAEQGQGLISLLPMVMQAISSFSGPEGQKTQQKHKEHAWVLPPLLEQIHVMWDHFSQSELAEALWKKSGVNGIFTGFTGRDGKLDYERLFESLENQSFRRRWIKAATLYLADWVKYLADPEVYQRYLQTGQMVANGFFKSQGFPKTTFLDPNRPSETISNLIDHVAMTNLNVKVHSITYVKPGVNYIKDLLKLGQARGLLQQFNSTDMSDKLTDTLNLEVIEPVLKVYRAYRHTVETPHCDRYILCEVNSHDPNEKLGLAGFKSGITKFGSMAAAWFISGQSGTPFWTLFSAITEPHNCQTKYPSDCSGFHDSEAKVTTEYMHNEL